MKIVHPFADLHNDFQMVSNSVFREVMPALKSPSAFVVLCFILDRTKGRNRLKTVLSYRELTEGTGIKSINTIKNALAKLEELGFIQLEGRGFRETFFTLALNRDYEVRPNGLSEGAATPDTGSNERQILTEATPGDPLSREIFDVPENQNLTAEDQNLTARTSKIDDRSYRCNTGVQDSVQNSAGAPAREPLETETPPPPSIPDTDPSPLELAFARIVELYPPTRFAYKPDRELFFQLHPSPEMAAEIIACIEAHLWCDEWQRGIIPNFSRFLQEERWRQPHPPPARSQPSKTDVLLQHSLTALENTLRREGHLGK